MRRPAIMAALAASLLACAACGAAAPPDGQAASGTVRTVRTVPAIRGGDALFSGTEPLRGAIRGHRTPLPSNVVRCSGCHARGDGPRAKSALGDATAPALGPSFLLEPQQRRGGPPSSYDATSFCKVLRTGVDPASIIVGRIMPVFEIDDAQCVRLFRYLTEGV